MACHLQIDADPDLAFHFDADLDPHPAYQFDADLNAVPDPTFRFDADLDHCWEDCFLIDFHFILKYLKWCSAYCVIAPSYLE